jgi:hypothetical protein
LLSMCLFWVGPAAFLLASTPSSGKSGAVIASLLLLPLTMGVWFQWGFLNWYSGVGVAFLVLAHQHLIAARRRRAWHQLLLHSALIALLFLWHLSAWAVYVVVMGSRLSIEVLNGATQSQTRRERLFGVLWLAGTIIPSLVLLMWYKRTSQQSFAVDPRRAFVWGTWGRKFGQALSLFQSYDITLDVVVCILWLAAVFVWFRPLSQMVVPCATRSLPLIALVACYLVLPQQLGTTSPADGRVLPAILICALALLADRPVRRPLLGGVLLASSLIVRDVEVDRSWKQLERRLETYAGAFQQLTPRSRVLPVTLMDHWGPKFPERTVLAWAVAEREIFVPDLTVGAGQFLVRSAIPCNPYPPREAGPEAVDLEGFRSLDCYDFLWVLNCNGSKVRVPAQFEVIDTRNQLTVWKRAKPGTGSTSAGEFAR